MFYILLYTFPHGSEFHALNRDGHIVMVPEGEQQTLIDIAKDYQEKNLFGTTLLCKTNGIPL